MLSSNHLHSLHGSEADSGVLLDWLGTHFMSWAALNSYSKALCAHTSSGSLWQRQGLYYLPRHNAATWTSNTFLWLDGSIMQNRAPFRSVPWAPAFMTCFFILSVKEEVAAPGRALTNDQTSNQRRAQSSLLLLWFDAHYLSSGWRVFINAQLEFLNLCNIPDGESCVMSVISTCKMLLFRTILSHNVSFIW